MRYCFLLVAVFVWSCTSKPQPVAIQAKVNQLPFLDIMRADGTQYSTRSLEGNHILVLYLPDCDHCVREAKEIAEFARNFDGYTVHFFTSSSWEEIEGFRKDTQVDVQLRRVEMGITSSEAIVTTYGSIQTPAMFIYRNQELVKKFEGETPLSAIIPFL